MKIYNWNGYDFVGTAVEFAHRFAKCKCVTYVNAIKSVSRHTYNRMDAREQAVYDEKRSRAKRAYCIYMDDTMNDSYLVTREEYDAINLPIVEKTFSPVFLAYKDIALPYNFIGNHCEENRVPSAMKAYRMEAERFARQVMLATGYFNTRDTPQQPDVRISHTSIYLNYPNGVEMLFDSMVSNAGVDNCRLTSIRCNDTDIYNCFRQRWTGTVSGVADSSRCNPDCQSADLYYG